MQYLHLMGPRKYKVSVGADSATVQPESEPSINDGRWVADSVCHFHAICAARLWPAGKRWRRRSCGQVVASASRFKHANHPAKLGQEYVQECQKAATANGLHDYLKAKMAEREVGVGEGACDACRRVLEAMHVDWLHLLRHVLLGPRHIPEGDTDLAIAE